MRIMAFLAPELPTKPTDMSLFNYDFELEKYKEGIKRVITQHFRDQDNNA